MQRCGFDCVAVFGCNKLLTCERDKPNWFAMLRINADDLENILFTVENIVERSESAGKKAPTFLQELRKQSKGIPKTLSREFVEVTKILVTPSHLSLGQLVVMTGIDKSGKETQAFNHENKPGILSLYDCLIGKSFKVLKLALPSYYTALGSLIASYLGKENSQIAIVGNLSKDIAWVLWSLDRAQHNPRVEKWLEGSAKNFVLSKRWTETNIAYQKPLGIDEKRILRFERNIAKADYTIILDIPIELVFRRMETSGEIPDKYETSEFLRIVSETYRNLEHVYPYGKIFHVDGSGSFEEVNKRLLKIISHIESSRSIHTISEKIR